MSLIVIIFILFINKMYFNKKNINKMNPILRAKLKIPVFTKSINDVNNMEIQLDKDNKYNLESLKIEPTIPKKIEKNDIEKIYLNIDNLKKEILEIKTQMKDIVDIIQTIMIINK
jgi:hypothetical protein